MKGDIWFLWLSGIRKKQWERCTYQCHKLQFLGLAWVQVERKQEQAAKAKAYCPGQVQRDGSHGERELLLAAVGGAALQKPPGGKCLFNQEIDRKAEPCSSLVGFREGWGRAWHANNTRSYVCSRSQPPPSIRTLSPRAGTAGTAQGPHSGPAFCFAFRSPFFLSPIGGGDAVLAWWPALGKKSSLPLEGLGFCS